jgi:hypothetical protein
MRSQGLNPAIQFEREAKRNGVALDGVPSPRLNEDDIRLDHSSPLSRHDGDDTAVITGLLTAHVDRGDVQPLAFNDILNGDVHARTAVYSTFKLAAAEHSNLNRGCGRRAEAQFVTGAAFGRGSRHVSGPRTASRVIKRFAALRVCRRAGL